MLGDTDGDVGRVLHIVPPSDSEAHGAPAIRDDAADDEALVAALKAREPSAAQRLVERHGPLVSRVLMRVLGSGDSEHADVLQEVIVRAWQGIGQLHDPRALRGWLTQIAVFTARGAIRRRKRRRWLAFFDEVPEPEVRWAGPEVEEAARCVYRIFDRMPVDERIPLSLRMIDGLDLDAIAGACDMSVATVRRRLVRAERRFFKLARQFEALWPWLGKEAPSS